MKLSDLKAMLPGSGPSKTRHYALQNAHCLHIAAVHISRAEILRMHTRAFVRGYHSWRIRLYVDGADTKTTCDVCRHEIKVIAPGRRKQFHANHKTGASS